MKKEEYKPVRMPKVFYCSMNGCDYSSSIVRTVIFHEIEQHGLEPKWLKIDMKAFKERNKESFASEKRQSPRNQPMAYTELKKIDKRKVMTPERLLHLKNMQRILALKRAKATDEQIQRVKKEYQNMKESIKDSDTEAKQQQTKKDSTIEQKVLKTTDLLVSNHNGYDVLLLSSLVIWPLIIVLLPFYAIARLIVGLFKWLFKKG